MKLIRISSLLLFILFSITCSKEQNLDPLPPSFPPSQLILSAEIISFPQIEAGSSTFIVNSDSPWKLSVSNTRSVPSWCKAEPSSGGKGSTQVTVTITENNESYDDRLAYIKVTNGKSSALITIAQKNKNAIILTQEKFEIGEEGGKLTVEIKSNIEYSVTIPKEFSAWITQVTNPSTRGLDTKIEEFNIAQGDVRGAREGLIIFEGNGSRDTVHVYQSQKNALILSQKEFNINSDACNIDVELKSNIEYDVIIPASATWISNPQTRAMVVDNITFAVEDNKDYSNRVASIIFKDRNSDLSDTLRIHQSQKNAIILTEEKFEIGEEGGKLTVEIKSNIEYSVTIPKEFSAWITQVTNPSTRGLDTKIEEFNIAQGDIDGARVGLIIFEGNGSKDTIHVYQSQKNALILSQKEFNINSDACNIDVELKSNIEYDVIIPASATWISNPQTRAMVVDNITFAVEDNKDYSNRVASIIFKDRNSDLSDTLRIHQSQKNAIILTEEKFEIGEEGGKLTVEIKSNIEYSVTIPKEFSDWITQVTNPSTRGLDTKIEEFNIAQGDIDGARVGLIIFEGNGSKDTIHVYQSQKNALILTQKEFKINSNSCSIDVELKSNIEYDVIIPASVTWISNLQTRAMVVDNITFAVEDNKDYSNRVASIIFKDRNSNLSDTLKVYQSQMNAIIAGNNMLEGLPFEGVVIEVGVKTNVGFSCELLDNSSDWLSVVKTRALRDTTLTLSINKNGGFDRSGAVRMVGKDGVSDTLFISQDGVKSILMEFYHATDGDNWSKNDNWGSSLPISQWYGIVTNDDKTPKMLQLYQNNLTGVIPSSISKLSDLELINLYYNNLSGDLEQLINKISELKYLAGLNLAGNKYHGKIPPSIGSLESLDRLSLYYNNLTGSLPKEIANLKNLEYLDVNSCNLTGTIPDGIGKWPLRHISANYNNLTGPLPMSLLKMKNWQDVMPYVINQDGYCIYPPKEYAILPNLESKDLSLQPFKAYDVISNYEYTVLLSYSYSCIFSDMYIGSLVNLVNKYRKKGLGAISYHVSMFPGFENLDQIIDYSRRKGMDKFVNLLHLGEYIDDYGSTKWEEQYFEGSLGTPSVLVVDKNGALVFGSSENRDNLSDFLVGVLGDPVADYKSTNFSKDGEVLTLQKASVGNGIDIVIMGDGFVDKDMGSGGKYETRARESMEAIFSVEPAKSFRNNFNVYCVKAVSLNEGIGSGFETVFSTQFGEGTHISGNNSKCEEYALKVPGINNLSELSIVTILNDPKHGGTCYLYTDNSCIAYCPTIGYDYDYFSQVVLHEVVGHGIGKLADEYSYHETIPSEEIQQFKANYADYGWWSNVDFTNDPNRVKWKDFLINNLYTGIVGIYEGGCTYKYGVYKPSETSIMHNNSGEFNAPSRLAIYKRILELSGESFNFEKFLEYDVVNRFAKPSTRTTKISSDFKPFAPPVILQR